MLLSLLILLVFLESRVVGLLPGLQLRFVLRLHLLVHQLHLEGLFFELLLQLVHSLEVLRRDGFGRCGRRLRDRSLIVRRRDARN